MYSTSDLKRGVVIELDGAPHVVETVQISTPTARGGNTIHRCKLRNLATKQRVDKSFRGGETFGVADVERRKVQFLYRDPDSPGTGIIETARTAIVPSSRKVGFCLML